MDDWATVRGKGWLYGYLLTLALHLAAIPAGWQLVRFVSKPMLMPLLLVFFLANVNGLKVPALLASLALFFSWLGDIFLMNEGERYFIAGLASFLAAHVLYTWFFARLRRKQASRRPWNIFLFLALSLYVGVFYFFLGPALAPALKIPVFVYAIVIATMFAYAWHAVGKTAQAGALYFISGAALFILSDSLLAINAFLSPFAQGPFWVMATYGLAQLGIIGGIRRFLASPAEQKT